jgi:hypothetical protein
MEWIKGMGKGEWVKGMESALRLSLFVRRGSGGPGGPPLQVFVCAFVWVRG